MSAINRDDSINESLLLAEDKPKGVSTSNSAYDPL
jgi:hypothetical protein